jgi:2-polyprenyl-6-methoxyphenol hydroxylase-like FAD-dependent oxidoreductase
MNAVDVAVAGGGPAGLAVAIAAAREGLSVRVFERRAAVPDKACGEGILPRGVRALAALGAELDGDRARLDGVRYVERDGLAAEGRLRGPAFGVRRPLLVAALRRRAQALAVELRDGCAVRGHSPAPGGVLVDTDGGAVRARLLVAADGLGSAIRRASGLELPRDNTRRFGLRRHFRVAPWSRLVEVHFGGAVECYVTPVGSERVGIAFLWDADALEAGGFDALLAHFPTVRARLAGAAAETAPRGAGPLARRARAHAGERLLLVGDAAGYIDALSGEGLSLALACAVELGPLLPAALERGATREALAAYERIFARHFRRYALVTRGLLALARRPRLRRATLRWLAACPSAFDAILAWAVC